MYGGNYDIFFWNFLIFEIALIMDFVQMKIFSYNGIYFSCSLSGTLCLNNYESSLTQKEIIRFLLLGKCQRLLGRGQDLNLFLFCALCFVQNKNFRTII